MKRRLLIVCAACALVLFVDVAALAQNGRGRGGGKGTTCGDGQAWSKTEAEYSAFRNAQAACESLGGSSQGTYITYSGCGLFSCQATACTMCIIPTLPGDLPPGMPPGSPGAILPLRRLISVH